MSLIPCILDAERPHNDGEPHGESLLTLPLGTRLLIQWLIEELAGIGEGDIWVVATTSTDLDGIRHDGRRRVRILNREGLTEAVDRLEPSDYLLIVEPGIWPLQGYDFRQLLRIGRSYRGATHAVAIGRDADRVRERVAYDASGRVQKVERLFGIKTWPEASTRTFCSIVPGRTLVGTEWTSLRAVRSRVAQLGLCAQDVPFATDAMHLEDDRAILTLSEHTVAQTLSQSEPEGFAFRSEDVLVGPGCRIHPDARIVGPAILHAEVEMESGATVVGPAVLGSGCIVRESAVLAHAIVTNGSEIAPGASVCHRIVSPRRPAEIEEKVSAPTPTNVACPSHAGLAQSDAPQHPSREQDTAPWLDLAAKRLLDVLVSFIGLLVLSPLLAVVAVLIKLTSPGPVFFVHPRERKGGAEFPCIKFRTMVADAHAQQRELYQRNEVDGPQFKIDGDPRITRIGQLLRTTNIDEVPQLINVLLGHMSLVGPRPSPFRENQICVPWRRARLSVRPGITGLWQICRDKREEGDFHQWIYYDMAYVRHRSFWLDVKILFYTIVSRGGRWPVPLAWLVPPERMLRFGPHGSLAVKDVCTA